MHEVASIGECQPSGPARQPSISNVGGLGNHALVYTWAAPGWGSQGGGLGCGVHQRHFFTGAIDDGRYWLLGCEASSSGGYVFDHASQEGWDDYALRFGWSRDFGSSSHSGSPFSKTLTIRNHTTLWGDYKRGNLFFSEGRKYCIKLLPQRPLRLYAPGALRPVSSKTCMMDSQQIVRCPRSDLDVLIVKERSTLQGQ